MGWRSGILAVAALVMASGPAWADEAQELALSQEIMELSGSAEQMGMMIDLMLPMVVSQVQAQAGLSEAQANRLGQLFAEEFQAETPTIIEAGARVYVETFTEGELRGIRDFYASAAGQALRRKAPEIASRISHDGEAAGLRAGGRAFGRLQDELGVASGRPKKT
jgi:hypothetical protein